MRDKDNSPAGPPPGQDAPRHSLVAAVARMLAKTHVSLTTIGSEHPSSSIEKATSDQLAQHRTSLAVNRTLMAADRSLMAWVRTALSMISFGFTIYKVLQGVAESGVALGQAAQPRVVGLFLIGLGNVAVVMGIVEYWYRAKDLSAFEVVPIWRPSFAMALFFAGLSVMLFIGVIARVL